MESKTAFLLVLLTFALSCTQAKDCQPSHFDLVGTYTLGKQDQLNRTFTKLQEKITDIGSITYNSTPSTQYSIFNTKPIFFYRDSKQNGKVLGNDTIVIFGGKLEVNIAFNWTKTNVITRNGSGNAFGLSDMISFAKQIIVENGSSYSFELLDYDDVTWTAGQVFSITRIDPADATDDDKLVLTKMLNNIMGYKTIRNLLEEEIDKIYGFTLRASLHDQHTPIHPQFDYIWSPNPQTNITISMLRRAVSIDVEEDGIRASFDQQAEKATNWTCPIRDVPTLPRNPKVYGNTQQFISLDFYENMIKFAIANNYLDSPLDRENWESSMFQFFAGDLYEILPLLQNKYYADKPVVGNCKATYSGLKVIKNGFDTFNVSLHYDCELNVDRDKILDLAIGLVLSIEVAPTQNQLNFKLRSHDQFPTFYPYGEYKIQNNVLAELMVKHSLNRLYEKRLFGSGWPFSPPMDYPHVMLEDNFTHLYDSTHVDPHMNPQEEKIVSRYE